MTIEEELGRGLLGTTYRVFAGYSHSIVKVLDHADYYYLLKTAYGSKRVNLAAGGLHGFRQLGRDGERFFLKTTEVRGRSVRDIIDSGDRMPLARILASLKAAATILQQIHGRGVVHGGIKPGNVFITPGGGVTLSDCGHAEIVRRLRPEAYTNYLEGRDGYLPPGCRQADRPLDESCDTCGLGALLYALTIRSSSIPSNGPGAVRLDRGRAARDLPEALAAIILKATHPEAAKRYPNASAFLDDLDALEEKNLKKELAQIHPGPATSSMELEEFDFEIDEPEPGPDAFIFESFGKDPPDEESASDLRRRIGTITFGEAPQGDDDDQALKTFIWDDDPADPPPAPAGRASHAPPPKDPFTAPSSGVDPFASPSVDPFAPSTPPPKPSFAPPSGADPFAPPGRTEDPFAAPDGTGDPFAPSGLDPFAPGGEDPFAPPAAVDPFAPPAAGVDLFAEDPLAPFGGDPFAPARVQDPFAPVRGAIDSLASFSVFAPGSLKAGSRFVLSIWCYRPNNHDAMARRAGAMGDEERGSKGPLKVKRGGQVSIRLSIPGFVVEDPVDEIVWQDQVANVSFEVQVPSDARSGEHIGRAHIAVDGVPLGKMLFTLIVAAAESETTTLSSTLDPTRLIFASYVEEDRPVVEEWSAVASSLGREVFLKAPQLRRRPDGREAIRQTIASSDMLCLFWSSQSSHSPAVDHEWRLAADRLGVESIQLVLLSPPAVNPLPEELRSKKNTRFPSPVLRKTAEEVARDDPSVLALLSKRLTKLEDRAPEIQFEIARLRRVLGDVHSALNKSRLVTERLLYQLCMKHDVGWGKSEPTLERMIGPLISAGAVPKNVGLWVRAIQGVASPGSHYQPEQLTETHLETAILNLVAFVKWFYKIEE